MSQALRLLENEQQELHARIECLQGDRDQHSSETRHLRDQLRRSEEEKRSLVAQVQHLQGLLRDQSLQLQEQERLLQKDQSLPVWNPKLSHEDVEPGAGKEKDSELREHLRETSQLQAKEKECRELHSELDNLRDEYLSVLHKLQRCREELKHSPQPPPRRPCGPWLPGLMAMMAIALALLLANKDNLGF